MSAVKDLSINELKAKLVVCAKETKKSMAEMLYYLRFKIKAQGKKGLGFGAWVEDNLGITRRTADLWADEWAINNGLKKKKPTSRKLSKSERDIIPVELPEYFSLNLELTPSQQEQFILAWTELGEEHATRLVFDTIVAAAKTMEGTPKPEIFKTDLGELPPKKEPATILEDLTVKASPSGKKITWLDEAQK